MPELALILPLVVAVAVLTLAVARRGAFRSLTIAEKNLPAAVSASRHFRHRSVLAMIAVVVFAAVLSAFLLFAIRFPAPATAMSAGHWLLLLPILTGTVGVAAFAFVPHFREAEASRRADLARRTPFTFGPRRAFIAPVVSLILLVALIVCFGSLAGPDGVISHSNGAGGGILGFAYGVPVLLGALIAVAVAYLAVRHVALAPRPSDVALRAADATVRLLAIRIILNTVAASFVMTAGVFLLSTGSTAISMSSGTSYDFAGELIPPDQALLAIGIWGHVGIWVGIACFVATVVFIVASVSDATRKPFEVSRAAEAAT